MADKYSQWLYQSRIKREISFQLGKGITRLQSPFSYQRVKGLVHLMQFFKVLLFSEDKLLFLSVQTEEDLCGKILCTLRVWLLTFAFALSDETNLQHCVVPEAGESKQNF